MKHLKQYNESADVSKYTITIYPLMKGDDFRGVDVRSDEYKGYGSYSQSIKKTLMSMNLIVDDDDYDFIFDDEDDLNELKTRLKNRGFNVIIQTDEEINTKSKEEVENILLNHLIDEILEISDISEVHELIKKYKQA